jgi:Fe2+ transport system protein FeoA
MSPSSPAPIPLTDLRVGATARLHETRLDQDVAQFLRAIGLTRVSEFRLCKHGEPCILQVRSTRIGLSGVLARQIYVVPLGREVT